jgi:hypothetical protein
MVDELPLMSVVGATLREAVGNCPFLAEFTLDPHATNSSDVPKCTKRSTPPLVLEDELERNRKLIIIWTPHVCLGQRPCSNVQLQNFATRIWRASAPSHNFAFSYPII